MKVRGKNVLVQILVGSTYVDWACAASVTLDVGSEMLEIVSAENGRFKSFLPSAISFTGALTGFTDLDKSLSLRELRAFQLAGQRFKMIFDRGGYTSEAYFYIQTSSESQEFPDSFNSFVVEVLGDGELKDSSTPPVPPDPPILIDFKYGTTNLDTTSGSGFDYKASINASIGNATDEQVQENEDVVVTFANTDNKICYFRFDATVPDFQNWSEINNPFQQNVPFGTVFNQERTQNYLYIYTLYQTRFSNPIKLKR